MASNDALPRTLESRYIQRLVQLKKQLLNIHSPSPIQQGVEQHSLLDPGSGDRKSTRLNSSHGYTSYAVFCLKKKKTNDKLSICENYETQYGMQENLNYVLYYKSCEL